MSDKEYDAVADAHRKIEELRLEGHDRERSRKGDEEERFGRMLSGAVREMHDQNKREREEGEAKRQEELKAHIKEMGDRITDSHSRMADALNAHTEALKAYTASREGDIEVQKTGTVQTPQGEHRMNVVEIHRRKKG